jgi:hypothetical protein
MRTLVYKRTHNDDPDENGCFGEYGCLGIFRSRDYEAVIGIGGIGKEAKKNGIDGKVNWIGIGPRKTPGSRPRVLFEHFRNFGTGGPSLRAEAPSLARRMYSRNVRSALNFNARQQAEIEELLTWAETEPPSPGLRGTLGRRSKRPVCSRRAKRRNGRGPGS